MTDGSDSSKLPAKIPPRRFEFSDDRSYKFWTIQLDGIELVAVFGKIGSSGQARTTQFATQARAKKEYLTRIRRKEKAGYRERITKRKTPLSSEKVWKDLEDHEPFLQAILESPDDPTGYAIYADWLHERNDPRGRFTHLMLMLDDPNIPFFQKAKIEKEIASLRQKHAREFVGCLAPWLMDQGNLYSSPFGFRWGQLSSIHCIVLKLRLADELRRSPYCRFLRSLAIWSTEVLSEPIEANGRHWAAQVQHGFRLLVGADFRNLRDLQIGIAMDIPNGLQLESLSDTTGLFEIVQSANRLESFAMHLHVDLDKLLRIDLPELRSLHVRMGQKDVRTLAESGVLPQLNTLEILNPINDDTVEALLAAPGFSDLSEFVCRQSNRISPSLMKRLAATDVVIDVLTT
ncbi:MAG: WGR domain-containing protein [Rubripirellula sp.]